MKRIDRTAQTEQGGNPPFAMILSVALHVAALGFLFFWFQQSASIQIVAAGPGEGGEGGGGSIEVGLADPSAILGFAKPQPVSFIGNDSSGINNTRVETERREPDSAEDVLPSTDKTTPSPDALKTDRPVAKQHERIFTGKDEQGRSESSSVQVGRSFGSPTPAMVGGVGLGRGGGMGGGTGLPGGSEYGRRIQAILSRNYNPPQVESSIHYVVIRLRIARDGRVLSIAGGRVAPAYVSQRSSIGLVNNAAERAILASDPLPPFPAGFLTGAQEAVAEVWFRYPK